MQMEMNIPRTGWSVLLIGGSLLAVLAYLVTADSLPSAEPVVMGKPAPLQATDFGSVTDTDKNQAAVAATSKVPRDEGDCIYPNSATLNPFSSAQGGCMPDIPSKEDIALSKARDPAEITQGHTYDAAPSVLNVGPDAPAQAYGEWQKCLATEEKTPQRVRECDQLWEVMPYITSRLDTESQEGSTKASLLMADHYAWVLLGAEPSTWQDSLDKLDKYVARVGQSYPQEMSALLESVKRYRTQ